MDYCKELDEQFRSLGFDNYNTFYKTAAGLHGDVFGRRLSADARMMDDLYSDDADIGYMFFVDKDMITGNWRIISIYAGYQMDTVRNQEGVLVISKVFDQPFPDKAAIRRDILECVRKEEKSEKLYQYKEEEDRTKFQRPVRRTGISKHW